MIQDVAGSSPVGRPTSFLFVTVQSNRPVQTVLTQLEAKLGYQFRDSSLLQTALTHPSIVAESKSHNADNQRLEFLGDAVLQLVLTEDLYLRFPTEGEGVLTKWRARLVSKPALAAFGTQLELGGEILMGKGEEANGGRSRSSTLADCIEAVLGAVYLDGGFEKAQEVVLKMVGSALKEVTQSSETGNPKGELQEVLQAITPESPNYKILSATGPDHDKNFRASVTWKGCLLGEGKGASKKIAEAAAASDALKNKNWRSSNDT